MPAANARRAIYSLLGSATLNWIDPEAYLNSVLRRMAALLPWNLFPAKSTAEGSVTPGPI